MQFDQNLGIINQKTFDDIQNKHVLIVGLGGLGGHLAHTLVRFGFLKLTLVDYDTFELSNLNRQLFSTHQNLGQNKVDVIKDELLKINPKVVIQTFSKRIQELDLHVINDVYVIVDATDHIQTKKDLESIASKLNVLLCHGAIGGWYGQFGIIEPHSNIIGKLYGNETQGLEKTLKSPTFTPAIIANLMALEIVKSLAGVPFLKNQIMQVDLLNHHYEIVLQKKEKKWLKSDFLIC